MSLTLVGTEPRDWRVEKIAVIGPGIVGMPMAAMLANARISEGGGPAKVLVVQRASATSGWKVDAINSGKSPIGGIEPDLDRLVADSVAQGLLRATDDHAELCDADVVLVCVQTDKCGDEPDYGPMFEALRLLAKSLQRKPNGNIPLIVFESTLAPSSMASVIKPFFAQFGLVEGRDVLLGNSPNRVMPGRLVERVASSDKVVAGLHPATPKLIERLYSRIVTRGTLHLTNSLTAEIVKTLENAYRDVRIALSTELCRYCDAHDIDYYLARDRINERLAQSDAASKEPNTVPSGALLVPMLGVGGHCLPKDGILLWWRKLEARASTESSLILASRIINDGSPVECIRAAERRFGPLLNKHVALLGAAYRFNSEDTRNSPTIDLARHLLARGSTIAIHDPYVYAHDANLAKAGLTSLFTRDLDKALDGAEVIFVCTAHKPYLEAPRALVKSGKVRGIFDAANAFGAETFSSRELYSGVGRGRNAPSDAFVAFAAESMAAVERGVANELEGLIAFLDEHFAPDAFNRADLTEVRRIANTCVTGCAIGAPRVVERPRPFEGFIPCLVEIAASGRA